MANKAQYMHYYKYYYMGVFENAAKYNTGNLGSN